MATALRPRLDAAIMIDGKLHQVSTSLRDTLEMKVVFKGHVFTGDMEDAIRLIYVACKRERIFDGSWDDFVDAVEDIEVGDPPPLVVEEALPDS